MGLTRKIVDLQHGCLALVYRHQPTNLAALRIIWATVQPLATTGRCIVPALSIAATATEIGGESRRAKRIELNSRTELKIQAETH